jgi:predicted MFS family arabinose efflux permease
MARFVGWRYAVLVGGLVGAIALAMYPIAVAPYLYPEKWQNIQKVTRAGRNPEETQPGGMKIWSDPFDRKKN